MGLADKFCEIYATGLFFGMIGLAAFGAGSVVYNLWNWFISSATMSVWVRY